MNTEIKTLSQLFAALEAGERVEFFNNGEWYSLNDESHHWKVQCLTDYCLNGAIRIAPKLITITGPGGTYEYPEPVRDFDQVAAASVFYFIEFKHPEGWNCDEVNLKYNEQAIRRLLKRGLIHLTEENAKAHAEALIKAMGGEV